MKDQQMDERLVFCENIKLLRIKNDLSCAEMAKRLGIGQKMLRLLECEILPPRLSCSILFRIEREFGVPPQNMFSPLSDDKFASS